MPGLLAVRGSLDSVCVFRVAVHLHILRGWRGCWCTAVVSAVPKRTSSVWRVEDPSPTGIPEVVVSAAAEDTTEGAAPLLELACWPCVMLTPAVATAAAASASSLWKR